MAEIEQINPTGLVSKTLLNDLRQIIDTARSHVAATAKYEVTMMYWNIGNRINRDVLSMENKLSRRWRDNCKKSTAQKDLMKKVSEG